MAGPLAGIPLQEIAKQKLPDQAQHQGLKGGQSKFDQNLKSFDSAQAKATGQVQQAQQAHQVQHASAVEKVNQAQQSTKVQKAELSRLDPNKVRVNDPVTQKAEVHKSTSMVSDIVASMEKSQQSIDALINGGLMGKQFTNQEMLSLQAGMYKYSQELDLTSKVVEKATTGLKDTLKTQV